jgi:hypothetical protein
MVLGPQGPGRVGRRRFILRTGRQYWRPVRRRAVPAAGVPESGWCTAAARAAARRAVAAPAVPPACCGVRGPAPGARTGARARAGGREGTREGACGGSARRSALSWRDLPLARSAGAACGSPAGRPAGAACGSRAGRPAGAACGSPAGRPAGTACGSPAGRPAGTAGGPPARRPAKRVHARARPAVSVSGPLRGWRAEEARTAVPPRGRGATRARAGPRGRRMPWRRRTREAAARGCGR